MRRIQIDNEVFTIDVKIKRGNKNIYMRIKDNVLCFTSPVALSDDFIKNMILKNYSHVIKRLNKPPLSYDVIHFLGKEYKLNIVNSNTNTVLYDENNIYIHTKRNENKYIQKIISLFYANELSKIVENNIENIKDKFNISYNITFEYKNVKSYFGECFSKRRHIILATKLAKYKKEYILNVIYHEMAHFYYQNHQAKFYELLERLYPGYRRIQKELKRIKYNDAF